MGGGIQSARAAPRRLLDLGGREPAVAALRERRRAAAGRSARARARPPGGRPPRTSAAPGACGPRGSSARAVGREPLRARRGGQAVVELDALAQRPQRGARAPAGAGPSRGRCAAPRSDGCVRRWASVAVVGQQDQAGGVGVEAADRVQPPRARRRCSTTVGRPVRVARGRDDAGAACGARRRRAGRRPRRPARRRPPPCRCSSTSRAGSRTTSPPTVTRPANTSCSDGAPRGDAGVGEVLGEAHRRCHPRRPWTSRCSTRRSPPPASPPSAPARCGAGRRAARPATSEMTDLPAALRGRLDGRGSVLQRWSSDARRTQPTARSRRCSTPTTAARSRRC